MGKPFYYKDVCRFNILVGYCYELTGRDLMLALVKDLEREREKMWGEREGGDEEMWELRWLVALWTRCRDRE